MSSFSVENNIDGGTLAGVELLIAAHLLHIGVPTGAAAD